MKCSMIRIREVIRAKPEKCTLRYISSQDMCEYLPRRDFRDTEWGFEQREFHLVKPYEWFGDTGGSMQFQPFVLLNCLLAL